MANLVSIVYGQVWIGKVAEGVTLRVLGIDPDTKTVHVEKLSPSGGPSIRLVDIKTFLANYQLQPGS